jgi:ectoine hydroxylase-related dioxygenase (phytanoyl-CoA dioxygenase family)
MVKTIVTIKGVSRACWLPVMDYKNKAIKSPDAFAVNTAIMRCLAKCIAMHGLGLYVYAGEDLPEEDKPEPHSAISAPKEAAKSVDVSDDRKAELDECVLIMIEAFDRDNGMASLELWRGLSDNDEKIYVWNELRAHSKLRAFIKANKQ